MKVLIAILVVMFLSLQYQLWAGEGSLPEVWKLEDELAKQRQDNLALQKRNMSLAAEVEDLKKGLDAVEEYARDELGMIKENEVFYQIITTPAQPTTPE
jgi:cell division protein FtsB